MPPKLTFSICSVVSFLFLISFYTAAEFFKNVTFPQAEGNAVEVGISMRYVLAGTIFLSSSMLFHLRHLTGEDNQKSVLFGTSIEFAVLCATLLTLHTTGAINAIPPIIATCCLSILCFFSQNKLKAKEG